MSNKFITLSNLKKFKNKQDAQVNDMIADEYDATKSYSINDLVIYDYKLYKCIGATTGAFDSSKWTVTTLAQAFVAQLTDTIGGAY